MNRLRASFAPYWQSIQHALFPQLEHVLGPLTAKQQQLVQTLEVIRIERWIPGRFRVPGRPPKDRAAIARAFVAKAVYDMPTTRVLLDRLDTDVALRRICGWEKHRDVPSESVFSRAFAEFAHTQLPDRVHQALIRNTHHDRLVGHLSRDSTAIEAREKPAPTDKAPPPPKRKRGRPRKGEERPKVLKRLDRQATMSLPAMLDDLPTDCDVGTKKNSKGYRDTWVGYKLHLDVADGQIPISCLLTSASLHDSQAAIPLATMSAERTTNLYDLMDAAYDAEPIRRHCRSLGHVPLIDRNLLFPAGWQRRTDTVRDIELDVFACHAPRQRPADPPVQLRPRRRLLAHDGGQDGNHVGPADLVDAPGHDGAAIPLQSPPPVLRSEALPRCRRLDLLARRAERREPRLPHHHRGIPAAARQLTIGECRRACLSEPDVRISAEPQGHGACRRRSLAAPSAGSGRRARRR